MDVLPSREFSALQFPKELELTHVATNKYLYLFFADISAFIVLTGHKTNYTVKLKEPRQKRVKPPYLGKSFPKRSD